jgi:hypothetical protein
MSSYTPWGLGVAWTTTKEMASEVVMNEMSCMVQSVWWRVCEEEENDR